MTTYKFKMGGGSDATVLFEEVDETRFAAKVEEELAKIPCGLPTSFNFGPVVEMPDGRLLADLQLRRWLASRKGPTFEPCPKCRERDGLTAAQSARIGYIQCVACGHMGPQLMAKPSTPDSEFFTAVVRAWNNVPR